MTVRFEFLEKPKIYWLVIDGPQPELCYYDPGRQIDLVVHLDERVFGNVILGRTRMADALDAGSIRLDGLPNLVKSFPGWIGPTRYAKYAVPSAA